MNDREQDRRVEILLFWVLFFSPSKMLICWSAGSFKQTLGTRAPERGQQHGQDESGASEACGVHSLRRHSLSGGLSCGVGGSMNLRVSASLSFTP